MKEPAMSDEHRDGVLGYWVGYKRATGMNYYLQPNNPCVLVTILPCYEFWCNLRPLVFAQSALCGCRR
jgi:hypothetical protein